MKKTILIQLNFIIYSNSPNNTYLIRQNAMSQRETEKTSSNCPNNTDLVRQNAMYQREMRNYLHNITTSNSNISTKSLEIITQRLLDEQINQDVSTLQSNAEKNTPSNLEIKKFQPQSILTPTAKYKKN